MPIHAGDSCLRVVKIDHGKDSTVMDPILRPI